MTKENNGSIKKSLIDGYNRHAAYFSLTRNRTWEEIDLVAKKIKPGCRVLDLGCGNGRLLLSLPDCEYVGIDVSQNLVMEAKKLHKKEKFLVGDITVSKTWEGLGKFDAIFAMASFHHLKPEDLEQVLMFCKNHLEPQGTVCATFWNLLQPRMWKWQIRSIFGKFKHGTRAVWVPFLGDFLRFHWTYSASYLKQIAVKKGFEVVTCKYVTRGMNRSWLDGQNLLLRIKTPTI